MARNFSHVMVLEGSMPPMRAGALCFVLMPANTPPVTTPPSLLGLHTVTSSSSLANLRFKDRSIPSFSTIFSAWATFPAVGAAWGR